MSATAPGLQADDRRSRPRRIGQPGRSGFFQEHSHRHADAMLVMVGRTPACHGSVELMRIPMSWRDELNPGCDLHQVLYRDDGEVLGCVLRLEGDPSIYAHTVTRDALRRLGAHPTVDAARRAVERAIGTEEGELWPFERVTRPARGDLRG